MLGSIEVPETPLKMLKNSSKILSRCQKYFCGPQALHYNQVKIEWRIQREVKKILISKDGVIFEDKDVFEEELKVETGETRQGLEFVTLRVDRDYDGKLQRVTVNIKDAVISLEMVRVLASIKD